MPIWVQWVSFALAVVGSISGLYALYLNHERTSIARRQEDERLEAKKKATFNVERKKEAGSKRMQDRFLLHNNGQAEARNVDVRFYAYDSKGNRKRIDPLGGGKVAKNINAGHTVNKLMVTAQTLEIEITWDDDFKNGNKLDTTLN